MTVLTTQRSLDAAAEVALRHLATAPPLALYREFGCSPKGLTEADADTKLHQHGENRPTATGPGRLARLRSVGSPFVLLLASLGVVFGLLGDLRGALTVAMMIAISVALRGWQLARSDRAMASLRDLVTTTVCVRRRADAGSRPADREIPVADLVPGDLIKLAPGDLVPADVRLLHTTDLLVDQAALTGESLPVRKLAEAEPARRQAVTEFDTLCFAGTSVVGGVATALVLSTGNDTQLGQVGGLAARPRAESSFDRGVRGVSWTLIRFMLVMAPIVLAVNGLVTADWAQAVLFAVAVAVGLTPEMLPVIVTANLARGAVLLSRRKVVVKRLNAIQDLGGMDVLCVDKTGTLTQDRIAFAHAVDLAGRLDEEVFEYAGLAAHFQAVTGDRLDEAILDQLDDAELIFEATFDKLDELPFDHDRRLGSVVLQGLSGQRLLIAKGDPDEILDRCAHVRVDGELVELTRERYRTARNTVYAYQKHGMRVLAIAAREFAANEVAEEGLALVGFCGFVDPIATTASAAVRTLAGHGVAVKVLTGDGPKVAERVCAQVGVTAGEIVLGHQLDRYRDDELPALASETTVFAKLSPAHKARVVEALRAGGHAVGFLGDGVNDAAALRAADVGIAPGNGTDVARDAADIILLERDLTVLADGVIEGRRTLGNTLKYVMITASSNFGNVISVLFASMVLPFLPMAPMQLLAQNLLYDSAQLALPWDRVDEAYLRAPRRWDASRLARFMFVFGPLSSLFDLATFGVLWFVLHEHSAPVFQAGWFVEGLASQVLIVLILRARTVSRPARPVLAAAIAVALTGLLLPVSPLAAALGMRPLPLAYLAWLTGILLAYALAARTVKSLYLRRNPAWLS